VSRLALLGGTATVKGPLARFNTIGAEERRRVNEVLDSGLLSGFYGSWGEEFLGGPAVRAFESAWARRVGAAHAVSVNSNTSGMVAAMGAIGISPGDEVIVPPYTMSATAMAPLFYGGIPVFADVEDTTYCLDVAKVTAAITPRTRAILVTNLFGHPGPLAELRKLADAHGLYLVEDNAQGPFATEHGRHAGTIGHIGVFSLNVHKHIQTGEGGICCTDDADLALRLQMIRNHAENIVRDTNTVRIDNMIGHNLRMAELTAAVGLAQLDKADRIIEGRVRQAEALSDGMRGLPGLKVPAVREGCQHVYYTWSAEFDVPKLGVSRKTLLAALEAEGFPLYGGYVAPLYRLPVFRERKAIGRDGFPFTLTNRSYDGALCPVTERLHDRDLFFFENCGFDPTADQIAQMCAAMEKVLGSVAELADHERKQAA
jgi:dTDP-4-amino-4,6-dideoxygalactose transaminase